MTVYTKTARFDSVKVRHSGDVAGKVIEGTYRVLGEARNALAAPADWSKVHLNAEERAAFAEAAHVVRFADSDGETQTPIKPAQLLVPRRRDDVGRDLWTTFNVAQENVIRGGMSAWAEAEHGRRRRVTARAINGIDQDVKLNKALWLLSQKMAELKSAA